MRLVPSFRFFPSCMLLLASTFSLSSTYSFQTFHHATFAHGDVAHMLPVWWGGKSSPFSPFSSTSHGFTYTKFVHRLAVARKVIQSFDGDDEEKDGFAVLQSDGCGLNLFLVSMNHTSKTATVDACLWYKETSSKLLPLLELRKFCNSTTEDGWKVQFGSSSDADAMAWIWGETPAGDSFWD